MTIDAFFAEFEKVHHQFDWTLSPCASPSLERREPHRLNIRAVPKDGPLDTLLDPIGSVCYARTGEVYDPGSWMDAASTLGMHLSESAMVMAASEDSTWTGIEGQRKPVPALLDIRTRLLETVGLKVLSS